MLVWCPLEHAHEVEALPVVRAVYLTRAAVNPSISAGILCCSVSVLQRSLALASALARQNHGCPPVVVGALSQCTLA